MNMIDVKRIVSVSFLFFCWLALVAADFIVNILYEIMQLAIKVAENGPNP